jgi:hypothetical protein
MKITKRTEKIETTAFEIPKSVIGEMVKNYIKHKGYFLINQREFETALNENGVTLTVKRKSRSSSSTLTKPPAPSAPLPPAQAHVNGVQVELYGTYRLIQSDNAKPFNINDKLICVKIEEGQPYFRASYQSQQSPALALTRSERIEPVTDDE